MAHTCRRQRRFWESRGTNPGNVQDWGVDSAQTLFLNVSGVRVPKPCLRPRRRSAPRPPSAPTENAAVGYQSHRRHAVIGGSRTGKQRFLGKPGPARRGAAKLKGPGGFKVERILEKIIEGRQSKRLGNSFERKATAMIGIGRVASKSKKATQPSKAVLSPNRKALNLFPRGWSPNKGLIIN